MSYTRKKKKIYIIILMLCIMIVGRIKVYAITTEELKKQQEENKQQLNNAQNKQEEIQKEVTEIKKEIESLNTEINSYENEIFDLNSEIEKLEKNITEKELEISTAEKELEEKEKMLEKRLVASYKAGETTYLDLLLSSENLTSFLSNYFLIEKLADADTALINTIKQTKTSIEESKEILEDAKIELENTVKIQELKLDTLSVIKRDKNQKISELSDEDKELEKKIEEMQAEDSRIREAIKAQTTNNKNYVNNTNTSVNMSGFILPIPAGYTLVTAKWNYSNGNLHGATDFGAGGIYGQPVYASKSGTVVVTENKTDGYGTYLMINHHDGTYTLYAHGIPGSICVSAGQSVSQGQQIMKVGSSGNSTGPHLHFEIRTGSGTWNERVNPLNYLSL